MILDRLRNFYGSGSLALLINHDDKSIKLTQAKACGYQIIFGAWVAATFRLRKGKSL